LRSDDDGSGISQQAAAKPLAEAGDGAALVGVRELPRRQVEEGDDERQAGCERDRPAHSVVDGAGGPAALRPPGGAD